MQMGPNSMTWYQKIHHLRVLKELDKVKGKMIGQSADRSPTT